MATCKFCQSKYDAMIQRCDCNGTLLAREADQIAREFFSTLSPYDLLNKSTADIIKDAAQFIAFSVEEYVLKRERLATEKSNFSLLLRPNISD